MWSQSMWIPCGFHMESMWSPVGSTSHPTKKKKLCGLHVDSTWSPVAFMWSRGVHEESMGQGKVHPVPTTTTSTTSLHTTAPLKHRIYSNTQTPKIKDPEPRCPAYSTLDAKHKKQATKNKDPIHIPEKSCLLGLYKQATELTCDIPIGLFIRLA